jgi:uncharacterized delta-60 repeat protein
MTVGREAVTLRAMLAILVTLALSWACAAKANALALDPAYAGDGVAEVDLGPGARTGGIATDGDAAVLAGTIEDGAADEIAVARLDGEGEPDPGFGIGGVATPGVDGTADSVAIQDDGKIVIAGTDGGGVIVVRLTTDGLPDPDFGTAGVASFHFRPATPAEGSVDVGIDSTGRIVVAGTSAAPAPADGSDVYVARLDSGGVLDPGFDADGIANAGAGPGVDDTEADLAVLEDDSICAVGGAEGLGDGIYPFAVDGTPGAGPPAIGPGNVYEAVTDLPGGGYLPVGTSIFDSDTTRWFSPSHHDLNFAEPIDGLAARARAVGLLDDDLALIGGSSNTGGTTPVVPAFVLVLTYPDTTSVAKWKFPADQANAGSAVDLAGDSQARGVALLDLAGDGGSEVSVARVSPALFDEPIVPGTLTLGELRVPHRMRGLLRHGARVRATCSLPCDVRLGLVVPKLVADRLDLPRTRIASFAGSLAPGDERRIVFQPRWRSAGRLRRAGGRTSRLHLSVARESVVYQGD